MSIRPAPGHFPLWLRQILRMRSSIRVTHTHTHSVPSTRRIFLGHQGPRDIPDKNFLQVAFFWCGPDREWPGCPGIWVGTSQIWKSFTQENFGLIFRSLVCAPMWRRKHLTLLGWPPLQITSFHSKTDNGMDNPIFPQACNVVPKTLSSPAQELEHTTNT